MKYPIGELIPNVSIEEYNAAPGLRSGDLHLLKRSPAHFRAAQGKERTVTDALDFGGKFHSAIENPTRFLELHVEVPEFTGKTLDGYDSPQSKEARMKKAAWFADLPKDAVVVTKEQKTNITGMLNAIVSHPVLGPMLKDSVREVSGWVRDPETGLILKFRPDLIALLGYILDFKSTTDARPDHFIKEIFSDRKGRPFYILNAAHYAHCARLMGLKKPDYFYFIAIEKEAPWGIQIYPMDIGCLGPGEQWRAELTMQYAKCVSSERWPCYPPQPHQTVPPEWASIPGGPNG